MTLNQTFTTKSINPINYPDEKVYPQLTAGNVCMHVYIDVRDGLYLFKQKRIHMMNVRLQTDVYMYVCVINFWAIYMGAHHETIMKFRTSCAKRIIIFGYRLTD